MLSPALRSVLAQLAAARKDETRLEIHLRDLYRTECAHCSAPIQADYFIWEKDAAEPCARYYHCPHCGDHGEHPATEADVQRARPYQRRGLQYALALERIAAPDDPDREHAEEALAAYPPRAIYALWSHPEPRPRPRALALPPRYREHNVWLALERAVDEWTLPGPERLPPIQPYPPDPGALPGLTLFDGPIRDLPLVPGISLALTVLPRPNPAFWTLSALWAAWLWGRQAAASFKPVLRRRRYDWNWHTAALRAAGEALAARLPEGAPLAGLAPEAEPGFTAAALAAFDAAGFALQGCARQPAPNPRAPSGWKPKCNACSAPPY
jgi:hypothetical protein